MAARKPHGMSFCRVACVYVGAVVGAGFASGREVWVFFARYGPFGMVGLATAALLFCVLAPILMLTMRANSFGQYGDLLRHYFSRSTASLVDVVITLYLFGVLSVMFTGSVSLVSRTIGLGHLPSALLIAAILIVTASPGMRRISAASLFLTPALVVGIALLCLDHLRRLDISSVMKSLQPQAPATAVAATASSLIYASYNMLMCLGVFASLASSKAKAISLTLGGALGGFVLGALAFLVFAALAVTPDWIAGADMPLLFIARSFGGSTYAIYLVAVWAAMITTALSMLISLTSRLSALEYADNRYVNQTSVSVLLTLACIPISYVGFAPLMDRVYLLFGVLGSAILLLILKARHSYANR